MGKATVVREGNDITIVAISMMVHKALEAAGHLEKDSISAEIIDPRTLSPIDDDTIFESVRKTGRLIVVDESPPRCSIATDIAARVSEFTFGELKAPIKKITCPHTPVPLSPPLEQAYIPSVEEIVSTTKALLDFS